MTSHSEARRCSDFERGTATHHGAARGQIKGDHGVPIGCRRDPDRTRASTFCYERRAIEPGCVQESFQRGQIVSDFDRDVRTRSWSVVRILAQMDLGSVLALVPTQSH